MLMDPATDITLEKLRAVQWLITRYDAQRTSLVSRAAVVLSANAIVAAGVMVLIAQVISTGPVRGEVALAVVVTLAVSTLFVTGFSLMRASQGLINVRSWGKSRHRAKEPGLFFGAGHVHGDGVRSDHR